jgi:hypothetical protein
MKNNQILKKPYIAPELTVVDFRVEIGMETSGEVEIPPQQQDLGELIIFMNQEGNRNDLAMGDAMGELNGSEYFGRPTETGGWGYGF